MTTYNWLHIPSNTTGKTPFSDHYRIEGVLKFHSLLDKLLAINDWNTKQPGVWQYWV